jgi:hypothetical protein
MCGFFFGVVVVVIVAVLFLFSCLSVSLSNRSQGHGIYPPTGWMNGLLFLFSGLKKRTKENDGSSNARSFE